MCSQTTKIYCKTHSESGERCEKNTLHLRRPPSSFSYPMIVRPAFQEKNVKHHKRIEWFFGPPKNITLCTLKVTPRFPGACALFVSWSRQADRRVCRPVGGEAVCGWRRGVAAVLHGTRTKSSSSLELDSGCFVGCFSRTTVLFCLLFWPQEYTLPFSLPLPVKACSSCSVRHGVPLGLRRWSGFRWHRPHPAVGLSRSSPPQPTALLSGGMCSPRRPRHLDRLDHRRRPRGIQRRPYPGLRSPHHPRRLCRLGRSLHRFGRRERPDTHRLLGCWRHPRRPGLPLRRRCPLDILEVPLRRAVLPLRRGPRPRGWRRHHRRRFPRRSWGPKNKRRDFGRV